MRFRLTLLLFFAGGLGPMTAAAADSREAQFLRDVAPVLETRCLHCHAGKDAKGGLSLETRRSALRGGDSGPAIVPGNPKNSPLFDAVTGEEPEMPKDGKPLPAKQIAALRKWIASGAHWPASRTLKDRRGEWWSFLPLKLPAVPRVPPADRAWARTPVDAFILRMLRREKLRPSAAADRRTLIRRLTFDLHGLPPSPAEVDAFVRDPSPNAYEKLVDRLLASPRYGERWGRHWLDVVHYGDTHGFDKDKRRPHAWPYRDYVIRSFNSDKPYGDFVREQLAGDVIRPGDPDGVVATGFIVAGPWDFVGHVELREGTTDKKITRNLDRDDMVMNTMSTFASLTVHCARCHDHKFDPIRQREYYQLQAVFAGVERAERTYDPDPELGRKRLELAGRLAGHGAALEKVESTVARHAGSEWRRLRTEITQLSRAPRSRMRPEYGYHSRIEKRQDVAKWVQVDLGKPTPINKVVVVGCFDNYAGIGAGFGFPVRYKIEASNDPAFKSGVSTLLDRSTADVPNPGVKPQQVSLSSSPIRYIRVTASKLAERKNDYIFALAELQAFDGKGRNVARNAKVTALDSIEAPVRWRRSNLTDGHYSGRAEPDWAAQLKKLNRKLNDLVARRVPKSLRTDLTRHRAAIGSLESKIARLPKPKRVYAAANSFARRGNFTPPPKGKPRAIHVLNRGSVKSPGAEVSPGTVGLIAGLPAFFRLKNPADESARRRALANWLTDRRNPLTWRSIVNRVWHYHFGRGIVDSPNDFGRMGSKPTHPELLDWLAIRFRDGGQSFKSLHRLILTSAVYRQQSRSDTAREKLDGGNRFLWRMNRRRLEAEALRDTVLAVTGRLDSRMHGPGYDLFGFESDHSPRYLYEQHDVDDPKTMRRTVYRFIVRSVPDPFMESLDCADPSINVPKRNTTITALQALALLNNRFMVRQAEHFAAALKSRHSTPTAQIVAAYETALGRQPNAKERTLLTAYTRQHGLANFCRLLFNTNEFLFVD